MVKDNKSTIIHVVPSSSLYYDRGLKAYDENHIDKAQKYFERGVSLAETEDDRIFGKCQLALLYQHNGNFQVSIDMLNELLEEKPTRYPELYFFQANNYAFVENYEKALHLTELYIRTDPDGQYLDEAKEIKEMIEYEMSGM
ncbi:tetratricopeptide repeat protein [Lacticigenium naphthae]|uniref:tetratricopeptide repeat protein n=1 Tax=Lacticigenium naphthae TaxID=515351 RepID=UPI0003FFC8CE|nr:hypothetical protein [Lacticigenium naphthae]